MPQNIEHFIQTYQHLYDLQNVRIPKDVSCIYVFLYTNDKRIGKYGLSGQIDGANIHKSLVRMTKPIHIGEITPIAITDKNSLIFMARAIDDILPTSGTALPTAVKTIIQQHLKTFDKDYIQNTEIETNQKYIGRYWIHDHIIKKWILTKRIKQTDKFNSIILSKMGGGRILDVSCGDSTLLNNKQDAALVVFNDISLSLLLNKGTGANTLITNHDATKLPFKTKAFDFALCRNTLHHMPTVAHLDNLLDSLSRVSEHVLIIEIENPEITKGFPKFLNKYLYRKFLHDVGERYLSTDEFKAIISNRFTNVSFSNFKTVVGNYMIADIKQ